MDDLILRNHAYIASISKAVLPAMNSAFTPGKSGAIPASSPAQRDTIQPQRKAIIQKDCKRSEGVGGICRSCADRGSKKAMQPPTQIAQPTWYGLIQASLRELRMKKTEPAMKSSAPSRLVRGHAVDSRPDSGGMLV